MRIPLNLRGKLSMAFLLVLLPVLGLVVYDYQDDSGVHLGIVLDAQVHTAEAVAIMVDSIFNEATAVGQALAIDPTVRAFSSSNPSILDPYLARFTSIYPQYVNINVWDAEGRNAGASTPPLPGEARSTITDRDHFQQAMATGRPAISGLIVSRIGGKPTMAIAVPVKGPTGHTLGVITLLLDLQAVSDGLQGMRMNSDQQAWVADSTGYLALHTDSRALPWEQRDISWYEPVRESMAKGRYAGRVDRGLSGDTKLAAAALTPRYGWIAGASTSEQAATDPVQRAALMRLAIFLGIVLFGSLLMLRLTTTITRPLGSLTRTMAAFARGDLQERVIVNTGDELETTAHALNNMASALQREQTRLRFLVETGAALSSDLDVDRVVQLLAEKVAQLLGEPSWVCLTAGEGGCTAFACHAIDEAVGARLLSHLQNHDRGVTQQLLLPVARTGEPLLIPNVASFQMDAGLREELLGAGVKALIAAPLLARGRPLGVLASMGVGDGVSFGKEEMALAKELGARAGIVLDNALLFEQVRDSWLRLQTILDTVPAGVMVAESPSGRFSMISRAAEEILGGSPSPDLDAERWVDHFGLRRRNGERYEPLADPLARTLLHGETVTGEELMMRHPSGRDLWLLVHSAPLLDEGSRTIGAVMIFQDITALEEVERKLEQSAREAERRRDELNAVIEGMGEGIAIADREGLVERINSLGRSILGVGQEQVEGHPIIEIARQIELRQTDGSLLPVDRWPMSRAIRGELFRGAEVVQVSADGTTRNLLFSSGVVRDETGGVQLSMTLFRDITPIRERERAREEFISVVAHDLRSPLTVITGFAGLLLRLPAERHVQPQERRAAESILASSKRLERMVGDLMDASRIEASRLVISMERIELPKLVQEVVDRVADTLGGHQVRVKVLGNIPPLQADPSRLEQLLVNLLSNAGKYSFPNTEILLTIGLREKDVMVSVTNWGQGVPQEDREAIFSRFKRARDAETSKVPGLGLGLYIAKGLVEAHGGRIWVESEMGKTTTFLFTLPLDAGEERGAEG